MNYCQCYEMEKKMEASILENQTENDMEAGLMYGFIGEI